MQCASSTANRPIFTLPNARENDCALNLSGATYASFSSPRSRAASTSHCCSQVCELFIIAAGMLRAASASTWSFISAISGETTSVMPSSSIAGSW